MVAQMPPRTVTKKVRFYEIRRIHVGTNVPEMETIKEGFWAELHKYVLEQTVEDRQIRIRGREAYGLARVAKRPAAKYFYIGGVRARAEWPDAIDGSGSIGDLQPSDQEAILADPTFILPFGRSNQVAVLSMSASSPRVSTIETWVTTILGKNGWKGAYTLIPIINRRVSQHLEEAAGATVFRVKVEQDGIIPPEGGGQIGRAARAAKQVSPETDIELKWSLANRSGSVSTKSELLQAARWITEGWVKRAEVSLELPDGDGVRRKSYDLVREQFTAKQRFSITADKRPDEVSVLAGMNEAIESFRAEFS